MIDLEEVPCGLCGSRQSEPYLKRKDLSLFLEGEFHLVRCLNCGLVYLNPRPANSSISEIYPDAYDQYTPLLQDEHSPLKKWERLYGLRKRMRPILKRKKSGRLLDVGCATGDFLEAAQITGDWDLYGVEISPYASAYARSRLGLPVETGSVEALAYPDGFFDVVTLWNVIEHLPDLAGSLNSIHRLLKPDGILVFNTPNLDSLDAKFFGQYWIGYELPRHFYIFSRKTLRQALLKTGFEILDSRCQYGSHALAMSSLRFFLRARTLPRFEKLISSIIFSLPFRVLAMPYFFISDLMNWSTAPTMVCGKLCE